MTSESFGKALGALIQRKRRAQGLSQIQLSEDAFGTPAKVRRISELENGLVSSPHPKTIDPIVVALKISDAEIEECISATNAKLDPELDRAYREARNLIDALAYQFDHAQPDAFLSDLDDFLRSKAKEWRRLRARVEEIDSASEKSNQLKFDANAALTEGDFEKADNILMQLEEGFQKKRTLVEVSKQANIRVTRGDACLMHEEYDAALTHYLKAAYFFQPFDEEEVVRVLEDNATKMYESGLRTLRPRFDIGVRLLEEALRLACVKADPAREAKFHYQLGLILRNAANRQTAGEWRSLIDRGIEHARKAASQVTQKDNAFQLASAQIALANCLLLKGERCKDQTALEEALTVLRSARQIALEEGEANSLLCHASNGIGATILSIEQLGRQTLSDGRADEAMNYFSEAIENAEKHFDLDVWGGTKINRARLLERRASNVTRPVHERVFFRIQAITEYLTSIETYPETIFPARLAQSHFELANVLFNHSLIIDFPLNEFYMFRAIQSYEVASAIFQNDPTSMEWAHCQMYIGSIFAHHADLDGIQSKKSDIAEAIKYFGAALDFFEKRKFKEGIIKCKGAISRLHKEMKQTSNNK